MEFIPAFTQEPFCARNRLYCGIWPIALFKFASVNTSLK